MAINFLALSSTIQLTSTAMLLTGADIFTGAGVRQSTPTSATIITTPPVFAGITSSTPHTNGSFNIVWPAATTVNAPIEFQIYAALGVVSAATLFLPANQVDIGKDGSTQMRIWTLGDQVTYFVNGLTYTFGVRAKDGVQNQNTNLTIVTATAIGSGNLTVVLQTLATDLAATEVLLAADHANFVADDAAFVADHANFVADDAAYDANNATLAIEIADLAAISNNLISALAPTKLAVTIKTQQRLSIRIKEGG